MPLLTELTELTGLTDLTILAEFTEYWHSVNYFPTNCSNCCLKNISQLFEQLLRDYKLTVTTIAN